MIIRSFLRFFVLLVAVAMVQPTWAQDSVGNDPVNPNSLFGKGAAAARQQADEQQLGSYNPPMIMQDSHLSPAMVNLGQSIAHSFWNFYRLQAWQITVNAILILCATIGVFWTVNSMVMGDVTPSKAFIQIFVKLFVVVTAVFFLAPNFPFVFTKAINNMLTIFRFEGTSFGAPVQQHRDEFLRKAMLFHARAAIIMDSHIADQYYTGSVQMFNGQEVPEYMAPATTNVPVRPGAQSPLRKVTHLSFIYAGPPRLSNEDHFRSTDGKMLLQGPVANYRQGVETFLNRLLQIISVAVPGGVTMPASVYDDSTLELPDPNSTAQNPPTIKIKLRPYAKAISEVIRQYDTLANRTSSLGTTQTSAGLPLPVSLIGELQKVDGFAESVLSSAQNRLTDDILANATLGNLPNVGDQAQGEEVKHWKDQLKANIELISRSMAEEFAALKVKQSSIWTFQWVVPIGLFFCEMYCVLAIWLMPPLLGLWAAFYLLPPYFDLSNSLKRGAAVVVAMAFYPVLLQLLLMLVYALVNNAATLDEALDPNRVYATMIVNGYVPNASANTLSAAGGEAAARLAGSGYLSSLMKSADAGVVSLIVWMVVLGILVTSPGIVAKMIMGIGAADAITQPVQSGAISGATTAVRGAVMGVGRAAGNATSVASAALGRRF